MKLVWRALGVVALLVGAVLVVAGIYVMAASSTVCEGSCGGGVAVGVLFVVFGVVIAGGGAYAGFSKDPVDNDVDVHERDG